MTAVVQKLYDEPETELDVTSFEHALAPEPDEPVAPAFPSLLERMRETAGRSLGVISASSETLSGWLEAFRRDEGELESMKALASKEYQETMEAASARRDQLHKEADAALAAIRLSVKSLEPARAELAERA